jgi:hypothetical protein
MLAGNHPYSTTGNKPDIERLITKRMEITLVISVVDGER